MIRARCDAAKPTLPLAALALLALLLPCTAAAHAILVLSDPPGGGAVASGTVPITLQFNSRIDRARSRLTLTGPDHARQILPIAGSGPPDRLDTHATLAPGAYTLRWQVLAIDGHITRGDIPFTAREH